MNLQIDAGNSFLKWRVLDGSKVVCRGRESTSAQQLMSDVDVWSEIQAVAISSVASEQVDGRLRDLFRVKLPDIEPVFASSEAFYGAVTNGYDNPRQLGVDRWLAIIASYSLCRESCFVVDCGSAITIDVVDGEGRHQGGYILPGLELMKQGLSSGTKKVEFESIELDSVQYGVNTTECVNGGAYFALLSVFEGLHARMKKEQIKRVIVTGGDGARVSGLLDFVEYHPDLVFEGLSLVTKGVK
ncbi:type III pantothenate kinase [Alkalimarinus sediminis]|uniref:Type III pantothenate kinase n=1 Tax=Alkalimarinus sediminis TaxID=1632866 RepID=A0A9E8HRY8_9ALTE|nr:type III pantothenate kinase [Alkalimarinus sediminis]UZW75386.1 type III pantothenate kinase [Alkalimarinus sediminis]